MATLGARSSYRMTIYIRDEANTTHGGAFPSIITKGGRSLERIGYRECLSLYDVLYPD